MNQGRGGYLEVPTHHSATPWTDASVTSPTDSQIPRMLPVVPGLVLAGQYALTEQEPKHRGDTLGACVLPGGRVGLMVADVVGHGPCASLSAAELRALLWSFLCDGATLVESLEGLDRHAARNSELSASPPWR